MADESVVDRIVKSLSFEVEAVPQGKNAQAASSSNMTPLNVKIRVRKKDKSEIDQGVLSVPKFGNPNSAPERIRLISSDQTVMSFNVLMEAELVKKAKKKPRKYFFGGCLGTQCDNDDDPYIPSATYSAKVTDTSTASKSDGVLKQNFTLLKNQIENTDDLDLPFNKKIGILGKCKPGGCLDPPFGEDNYKYRPFEKDDHSVKRMIEKKLKEKDQIQKHDDKKQHSDIVSLKSSKHSFPKKKDKDRVHDDSILSIYEADRLKGSLDTKCSDSIITYPPEVSSSTNFDEKHLKNRISSEEKQKNKISEGSEIFFSPSRKSNRQKESKEHKTFQESSSVENKEKQKAGLVLLQQIENVHEVLEDNAEILKKNSSPQHFTEATFIYQGTDKKNDTKPTNIDKDANNLPNEKGTKSGFEESSDIDHNLLEKLPFEENNKNDDRFNDVNSDRKSYSNIDRKLYYNNNSSNMIDDDLDHKSAKFNKNLNTKVLQAISSDELKDGVGRTIIKNKIKMKDDYEVADSTDVYMDKTDNMKVYGESVMEKNYPYETNTGKGKTNNRNGNVIEKMRPEHRTASLLSNELDDDNSIVESYKCNDESHETEYAKSTEISIDRIYNKRFKILQKSEEMETSVISILDKEIQKTPDEVLPKEQQLLNNNIYNDVSMNYIKSSNGNQKNHHNNIYDTGNNKLEEKKLNVDLQNNNQNPYGSKSTLQSYENDKEFIDNKDSTEHAFPFDKQNDTLDFVNKEYKDFSSKHVIESKVVGYPKLVPTYKVDEYKVLEDDLQGTLNKEFYNDNLMTPDNALFLTEKKYLNTNIEKADTSSQNHLYISKNSKESIHAKATYSPNEQLNDVPESTVFKRDEFGSPSDALLQLKRTGENVSTKDFDSANSVSTLRTKETKGTYPSTKQPRDDSESTGFKRDDMIGSPSEVFLKLERTGENVSTKDFDSDNSISTLRTKETKETYPSTKQLRDDSESTGSKRDDMFGGPSEVFLKLERTGENVPTNYFDSANSVSTLKTKVTYSSIKQSKDDSESTGSKRHDMLGRPSDALLKLERTGENVSTKDFDSANSVSTLRTKETKGTYPSTKQPRDDSESTGFKRDDMIGSPSEVFLKLERTGENVSTKDFDSANSVSTLRTKETKGTYPSTKQPRDDSESTGFKRDDMIGSPSEVFLKLERTGENVSTNYFDSANSISTLRTMVTYSSTKQSKDDSESTGSKRHDMLGRSSDALLKLERTGENVSTKDFDSANSVSTLRTKVIYSSTKQPKDDSKSTGSKRDDIFGGPSEVFLKLERAGENVSTNYFDSANSVSTLRTKVTYSSTKQSKDDSESTGSKRHDMFGSPKDALLKLEKTGENVFTKDFDSNNSVSTLRTKETKETYPLTKQPRDDSESTGFKRDDMFGSPSEVFLKLERTGENVSTNYFDSANSVSTLRTKVTYSSTKQFKDDSVSTGSKRHDMLGRPSGALLKLERTGENVSTKDFDSANSVSTLKTKITYPSTEQSKDDSESTGSKRHDMFGSPKDALLKLEKTVENVSPKDFDLADLASTLRTKATKATYPSTKQSRDNSESIGPKGHDRFGSSSDALLVLGKAEGRVYPNDFNSATSTSILETSATKGTYPSTKLPRDDSESTGIKSDNMFSSPKDALIMLGKTKENESPNDFHSENSALIIGSSLKSHNEYHSRTTTDIATTGLTSSRNSIIKENIILELGFQSYLKDKKERVLKSIDMSKELVHQSNEIITIIQSQIRPHLNDIIRVPIDSENEILIQIKRTKSPVRFQIQEDGQFDHKPPMLKFHGNGHAIIPTDENKSYHEKSHSKITGVKLQCILSSMYEQDLIPLQKSIKYLKQDIELLSLQRKQCKDKAVGLKRSKTIRKFQVNQRCGFWKD